MLISRSERDPHGHHRPIVRETVLYRGKPALVMRRLPGGRMDLAIEDGQMIPRILDCVHRGPGGWQPIPGEPRPDQATNRAR